MRVMRERKLNTLRSLDGLKRTRADNLVIRVALGCTCDTNHRRAIAIPTLALTQFQVSDALACNSMVSDSPLHAAQRAASRMYDDFWFDARCRFS